MNDWVVETPSFEEDLMNNRVVMLNQNGVNRVVEIIKEKDKEIEILNNIIDKAIELLKENACIDEDVEYFCDDLRYDDCKKLLDILKGSDIK